MRSRTIDDLVADVADRMSLSAGDRFFTPQRLAEYINQSAARFKLKLAQSSQDYDLKSYTLTTTSATLYNLPDDYWRMKNVSVSYGGFKRTIQPFMPKERPRWSETAVPPGLSIECRYTPAPQRLTLGANQSFDFVAGWEEWVVLDSCEKCAAKEETDPSEFARQKAAIEKEIEEESENRDAAWPERVTDVYERREYGFTLGVPRYRVVGPQLSSGTLDQIEILWGPLPGVAFWP